jgi:hypothetical protein
MPPVRIDPDQIKNGVIQIAILVFPAVDLGVVRVETMWMAKDISPMPLFINLDQHVT